MRLILLLLLYSLYLSLPVSFSRAEEPSSENSSTNSIADIEPELQKIIDKDNQAQAEVDKWIRDQMTLNKDSEIQMDDPTLPLRVRDHFSEIKQLYEDYLSTHPDSMQGRLAYASFLSDIGNENDATVQWNKLIEKHPQNPVLWNNLGNSFAQRSAPEKAFSYYEEAIRLAPKEPLYVKNLAAVVYLFRREAMDYYLLNELQAIQLAQTLYEKAALMDPDDFVLATQLAQTCYYTIPFDVAKARAWWQKAYELASDEPERQGVILHFARIAILNNQFDEAQKQLDLITYKDYLPLKERLRENLNQRQKIKQDSSTK